MVADSKSRNALLAINAILVTARSWALNGRAAELAGILDVAEDLPMVMLEPTDRTHAFRAQLVELAQRHPDFTWAVQRFDSE